MGQFLGVFGTWPTQIKSMAITFKELFPIIVALHVWGSELRDKCLVLHSDNQAVVHILNRQTSKDSSLMHLVRQFVLLCMKYNILVKAQHISGKLNYLPDLLSRLQITEFRSSAPNMDATPTDVEPVVQNLC